MRRGLALVLMALGCAGPGATGAAPAGASAPLPEVDPASIRIEDLGWLSGEWILVDGERRVEERWTLPAGGTMLGTSRTLAGDRTAFFEYLRIEAGEGGLRYVASPRGACPPTAFELVAAGQGWVRFENPAHDDPKVIAYRREGTALVAEIEGPSGGARWRYLPAAEVGP